jgi:hypothetical protein
MTASADGETDVRTGTIVISAPAAPAPTITQVRAIGDPFAIEITGTGFQPGVKVYIGSDTLPWAATQRSSSTRLVLTGSGLAARFPQRTSVAIKVVNPDGRTATTTYTRRR